MKQTSFNATEKLSSQTRKIWGKLSHDGTNSWLPLHVHLSDAGEVVKLLWDHWLPMHTKQIIAGGIESYSGKSEAKLAYAKKIAVFMALAHDIGKASPIFQQKAQKVGLGDFVEELRSYGLIMPSKIAPQNKFTHAIISEKILEKAGLDRSYAVVVGGHHGKPPNDARDIDKAEERSETTGINSQTWMVVQKELLQFALEGSCLKELPKGFLSLTAQFILNGLIIMADWIASGEYFSLISRDWGYGAETSEIRAQKAWQQLNMPTFGEFSDDCLNENLYESRFGIVQPRPMQLSALKIASEVSEPGIMVVEAPMGEGKTEAALAASEILACRYGLSGCYFALPTQATSDGMFKRIENWIENLHKDGKSSIFLAHGKAGFNKDYEGIKVRSNIYKYEELEGREKADQEAVIINDWTQGRKKGLLADFVVGTIDQILMCGLKQKHLALRHLGIVNKVVIIDECHAYDAYMNSYLDLVLKWLGAYHVPVVVLSATLPAKRRIALINAYKNSWAEPGNEKKSMLALLCKKEDLESVPEKSNQCFVGEYPLISYTDGHDIKQVEPAKSGRKQKIKMCVLDEAKLIDRLNIMLAGGGCVGIIRNTVRAAQDTAELLAKEFGSENIELLHSRFIACDRVQKEGIVRSLLGAPDIVAEQKRPQKLIVIGTQVMEQSLDVDFDVLFTDICPMDLLLQRMGRLHRHNRKQLRPVNLQEPTCFVMGIAGEHDFEKGSEIVYGKYLLLKTKAFLQEYILLPDDIPKLVEKAYDESYDPEMLRNLSEAGDGEEIQTVYEEAKANYLTNIQKKKNKARTFQIKKPSVSKTLKPQKIAPSLVGLLQSGIADPSGRRGEATVRDAENSLNVLVIVKKTDGYIYTLPWLADFADAKIDLLTDKTAKAIAGCSVSLPAIFSKKWDIDNVISELERVVLNNHLEDLYTSHWLEGELFLVLNEEYETVLLNKVLKYDRKYGLYIKEREEEG